MTDRDKLEQAIAIQESMRGTIPDDVIDVAITALRRQLAEQKPVQAIEQRKHITILYAGLSGFTNMAERMDAEDVGQIISVYYAAISPAIRKYGGIVEKSIGDEVMAVFGLPQSREIDPENGVRAALEMQQALVSLNERMATEWGFLLGMRIGIHTGPVIARYLGGEQERDFTVIGGTVNFANRLEKTASVGGVLISHDTYRHVRGVFSVLEQKPLEVKDKAEAEPVLTYLVQQVKPRAFRMLLRGVSGIETSMVGRDPELLILQNIFRDTVEDADVQVVTVVGEAGVGKSRLLYEFEKWVELLPEQVWYFKGRATPETETIPYGLIRRIFALRFEILDSDSAAQVREKFRVGMAAALDADQADLVGQLLGLDFSPSPAVQAQLGSDSFSGLATDYLVKYLRAVASEPSVIFLEDIHWADDSSLDLLNHLVGAVPDTRLLVVCLARPQLFERRPRWGEGQEFHTRINLKPLSRRASRALVEEILQKAESVPTELRDMIVEGAEGNPFYVEELIKMLMEDDVILHGEQHWRVEMERLAQVRVPPTLTGVLQARLDSLPLEEKMLLQRAAVVGRLFWDAAVLELKAEVGDELDREKIASLLEAVRERELIFRRERSAFTETDEYIFKHALLRDVAYETVLLRLRRMYHRQVARWLEVAAGNRIGEYLGLIAGHYELAGDKEKALEYLLQAGDQARLTYACQEASGYYRRALTLLDEQGKHDQVARILMKLGLSYDLAFDYKRARQAYEQGFTLWQRAAPVESLPPAPHPLRVTGGNPTTLDPTIADDVISSAKIIQLFSGLVELRPDAGVVPDIAQSWDVLEGGAKYIFHLRDDVHWSDSRPVTASDFEYAWKRVLGDHTTFSIPRLLYDVKGARAFHRGEVSDPESVGVKALDPVTLAVELEGPTGYFLHLLANAVSFPVPRHVVELHGQAWAKPENIVTCGAFNLKSWQRGEQMTMVRNPDYHGRFTGNLECVEVLLRDAGPVTGLEMLEMYQGDRLDVVDITSSEVNRMRQMHAGEYRKIPRLITMYLQFDVSRPPFDDLRVRQAFVMAADREALVKTVRPDCFPATGGFVPPGMPGHSPGVGLPCDPVQARQLLAEAGYPDGEDFPVIECLTMPARMDIGENLQEQWMQNLGLDVNWLAIERQAFLSRLGERMPHLYILGWRADYPDPDNFLRVRIGDIQRQKWLNKDYDSLVKQAQRSLDQVERIKLYGQAEQILAEETPIMPIFYRSTRLLVKPWVTRFPSTGLREWFFKDVIIKPHE